MSRRNTFMQHRSGVNLVFLDEVAALDGCGASSARGPTITTVGTNRDRTSGRKETGRTSTCRSTRQDCAADANVPARNESEWSSGRHSCPPEAGQVGWQRKRVAKLELRDEGAGRSHRSAVVGRHDECGDQYDSVGKRQHVAGSTSPECAAANNPTLVLMLLEVLSLPLDTNDVVNSLETMERKIKELERHASIEIPEFLKVGIVIRETEEGPMRTHLIMNAHTLTTFRDIKAEVSNVKQDQSAVRKHNITCFSILRVWATELFQKHKMV